MKIFPLIACVGVVRLFAADSQPVLKFEHTAVSLPSLKLKEATPFVRKTDVASPVVTGPLAVETFRSSMKAATTHSTTVELRRPSALSAPIAAGDLIGRAADRDKLIEEFQARTSSKKGPNKAPEPTPGAVTPRATEGTSK